MNQIWIVVLVIVALLIFTRFRNRRLAKSKWEPKMGPHVAGQRILAYLHPRMSNACLFDHGVQFGKGFRRKEGPELPHDEDCRCETVTFSFSSTEVFNGALRKMGEIKSSIENLPSDDGEILIERLKEIESRPIPQDREQYSAAAGPEAISKKWLPEVKAFLADRHDFLLGQKERKPSASAPEKSASMNHLKSVGTK